MYVDVLPVKVRLGVALTAVLVLIVTAELFWPIKVAFLAVVGLFLVVARKRSVRVAAERQEPSAQS